MLCSKRMQVISLSKTQNSVLPFNHFPIACSVQQIHCAQRFETHWLQGFILEIPLKICICRPAEVLRLTLTTRKTGPGIGIAHVDSVDGVDYCNGISQISSHLSLGS